MMGSFGSFQLLLVTWGVLFGFSDSFVTNEVRALTAFREAIYEDPSSVLSNWNALDADPCNWSGISCSLGRDHVIKLNLSSCSLRGFLAPNLGSLFSLQELILHKNSLIGTIPKEIGMLKNLKVLDLGMNQLTGPIPPEIGNLNSVMKINLQSNGLSGSVPPELGNLSNLVELRLDRNRLQGTVPGSNNSSSASNMQEMYASHGNATGFCRTSQLRNADFSYNFFVGRIPRCLNYLPRTSFQGNCFQDKESKQRPSMRCGASPVTSSTKSHPGAYPKHRQAENGHKHHEASKPVWLLALEIVTGTVAGFLLLIAAFAAAKRCNAQSSDIIPWKKNVNRKDHKDHLIIYMEPEKLKDVVRFSRQELEVACEDFSNIIGSSPDSLVYKGTMKGGPEIAVISLCIKEEYWTGYLELYFQREVADLARLNHENTGKLLGCCREANPFSRMLVFEYASNGTLYEHLHYGEGCQLSWSRRMKIILGIARGLRYLHTELEPPFTISELSSNAVYLTEEFFPKLVDFESWKTVLARSEKNSGSIGNGGTLCSFQESLDERHLDVQGNLFAFGVLLLEIISGRPPYCKDRGCLVDWAKEYVDMPEIMSYLVDPELRHFRYDDLKVICEVVSLCIQSDSAKRPSMKELCPMLDSRIDVSVSADLKECPLAWAELALSS
ncbi:probable LRR receptor-like serine/threonine-protein kinase At1g63430 isoform X2 [Macadamia integrifolia]|uniref:probable LRR receptor-like serine/threonine-protein kinase At1g63430 isoform X2 n=1 Tax=Macadamia integrifolia TaxID=60698 RepID=UPI001C4F7068|nr:probable LRR receptor-like serine/threonine-protein kinase At1g63430 isoform X2 [Macadamia integrifolia]